MGAVIMVVVIAVVLYLVVTGRKKAAEQVEAEWRGVAERHGLSRRANGHELTGTRDGVDVRIHSFVTGTGSEARRWTQLAYQVPGGVEARLAKEGLLDRVFGKDDVSLGDPTFDKALQIRGDRPTLLAVLDAARRETILRAVREGWALESREPHAGGEPFVPTWIMKGDRLLRGRLPAAAALGFELAAMLRLPPAEVPGRLAERATSDPEPAVRRHALEALVAAHRHHPATRDALERAGADADARVRLVAASARDDAASAVRAARELLGEDVAEVARLDLLEAPLLALAEGGGDEAKRRAALAVLGEVGSVAVVVPRLVPLREGKGALAEAARDAVLRIQARAGSPDAGRLAVVEPGAEGGLTLAPPEDKAP